MNNDTTNMETTNFNFIARAICNLLARTRNGISVSSIRTGEVFATIVHDKNNGEPGYPFTIFHNDTPAAYSPDINEALRMVQALEVYA